MSALRSVNYEQAMNPYVRYVNRIASRASNELVCDVVPCWCGAKPGEYCYRSNGLPGEGPNLHSDRRVSADQWRRQHPKEWKRLKDETFRRLIKLTKEQAEAVGLAAKGNPDGK